MLISVFSAVAPSCKLVVYGQWFSMSKFTYFILAAAAVWGSITADAQDITAEVGRSDGSGVSIKAATARPLKKLSFVLERAGAAGLGKRISDVEAFGPDGAAVAIRKFADGEYVSEQEFKEFSYRVDLSPRSNASAASVSWLLPQKGILMPGDLLPENAGSSAKLTVRIETPTAKRDGGSSFDIEDIGRSVIYVGSQWRRLDGGFFDVMLAGDWKFEDREAVQFAQEIFASYEKMFGGLPDPRPTIALTNFPQPAKAESWQAETRGANVTIVSADMNFATQSRQRLHEQLRHEIFHLWMPNAVRLKGNYDWFYEGSALYVSLRLGLELNRIRFEDLLDTISRAYNIDAIQPERSSLIEASKMRWAGMDTHIYARGLLTAFMCDVQMLSRSNGRHSATDLIGEVFRQGLRDPNVEANELILRKMRQYPELNSVLNRAVLSGGKLDITLEMAAAGLEDGGGERIRLRVRQKPTRRQNAILDKLGYNNWRKLSRNK